MPSINRQLESGLAIDPPVMLIAELVKIPCIPSHHTPAKERSDFLPFAKTSESKLDLASKSKLVTWITLEMQVKTNFRSHMGC